MTLDDLTSNRQSMPASLVGTDVATINLVLRSYVYSATALMLTLGSLMAAPKHHAANRSPDCVLKTSRAEPRESHEMAPSKKQTQLYAINCPYF